MMVRLFVAGLFMAAATLVLVQIGKTTYGSLQVGQTMALVGLALMNIFLALNLRFPEDSAFGPATLANPKLLWAFAWVVIASMLITEMPLPPGPLRHHLADAEQWGALPGAGAHPAGPRRALQARPAGPAPEGAGRHRLRPFLPDGICNR